ncbi:hypothetical protein AB0D91_45985 [Streptomyces canus]|uniref:hypothetical protein n=1 Tax=Streptomyces canus TaxID=58343 RepID=UPI0033FC4961
MTITPRRGGVKLSSKGGDVVVLGCKAGQGCGLELLQSVQFSVLPAQALAQGGNLGFETFDLSQAWVGLLSGFLGGGPLTVELGLEVWVGAVERGPRYSCEGG